LLVVSQVSEIHREIDAFLTELRRAMRWRDTPTVMPPTQSAPEEEPHTPPGSTSAAPLVTRIYDIRSLVDGTSPLRRVSATSSSQLVESIKAQVQPGTWHQVGGFGRIDFIQGFLIVSNTSSAHASLEALLDQRRQANAPPSPP
jgi:hypothetical protein